MKLGMNDMRARGIKSANWVKGAHKTEWSCFIRETLVNSRDVQNIFLISVRFQFSFLKTLIRFGMSLVRFGSKNPIWFRYYSYLLLM